jgi:hypothetical protein
MTHEDEDDDNKKIINGDKVAEWENFMFNYWRMLPPPSTLWRQEQ